MFYKLINRIRKEMLKEKKVKVIIKIILVFIIVAMIGYHSYCHHMVGEFYKYVEADDTEGALSCIEKMPNVNMLDTYRPSYYILGLLTQYASAKGYPLYWAIWEKADVSVIEALLEKGADPNKRDLPFSETPLHCLCGQQQKDMYKKVTLLIEHGADVKEGYISIPSNWDELTEDSREDKFRAIVYLWENGVDEWLDIDPIYKRSALHIAAQGLDVECLEKLYKNEKRPMNNLLNEVDADGETPLFWAARAGEFDNCEFLIEEGADITIKNNEGKTAYDIAIESGYEEYAEKLNPEENWEYLIQPGEYEEIKLINSNLIAVKDESGNYGIINRKKDFITDFEYFNVWGDEESIVVMDHNKKFSILDCEGNLISEETYDGAELFCEDLAAVKKGNKWGFIDREGNLAIDYRYDNIYGGFSEGLAAVEIEGMWRFIDTDGKWAFGMDFEKAHSFSEGLAAVMQNGVWGFIDPDGQTVIEGQYYEAGDFGEGMAAVCKEIDGVRQWGYIDKDGNVCIDFQPYDAAEGRIFIMGEFHDGYAIITDTFYCLINKNGQCVLGKDDCFLTGGFDYSKEAGVIPAYDYADENMMIRKYGLVDINGNEIIPFMFYNISNVQGDLAAVASKENMITDGVIVFKHE